MKVRTLPIGFLLCASMHAAGVTARFDLSSPETGPFPTDALTVEDADQKTGRRINLPLPDCRVAVTDCQYTAALNQLDGFSLTPRVTVRFNGPVRPETLRDGVFLIALENLTTEELGLHRAGSVIAINQVIWDPATRTLYAKPDELLDQHRRYALIVTTAVRDADGAPVEADPEFVRCTEGARTTYCWQLGQLVYQLNQLSARLLASNRVVAASLFTTLSATVWIESARDALRAAPVRYAKVGARNVFAVSDLDTQTNRFHTGNNPVSYLETSPNLALLQGVARIAFGSFPSPSFLDGKQIIPTVPTAKKVELPVKTEEVHFQIYYPPSPRPPNGYPVVIGIPGAGATRFNMNPVWPTMAAEGFAGISLNPAGHAYGPQGHFLIKEKNGAVTEFPMGGRGLDLDGDNVIGGQEGCVSIPDYIGARDCNRQTALDLMQLVRVIQSGIDLDGDGLKDLDPERIQFIGNSNGSHTGTILTSVDAAVSSAVLGVPGGTPIALRRLSPSLWGGMAGHFAARIPAIPPNKGAVYEDDYVLRDQPVKISDTPRAAEIRRILDTLEWVEAPGDELSYAPHLRASPLAGVPQKRVLIQIARGDQTVPNPTASAFIRAGGLQPWSVLYRHDLARAVAPTLGVDPHAFMLTLTSPPSTQIAQAAHRQAVLFFGTGDRCASNDPCVPDVNAMLRDGFGRSLFEIPEVLPEDLGFLQ